jgi:hypothetical protein
VGITHDVNAGKNMVNRGKKRIGWKKPTKKNDRKGKIPNMRMRL